MIEHSVMVSARGCPGSTCISPVWLERCKLSLSLYSLEQQSPSSHHLVWLDRCNTSLSLSLWSSIHAVPATDAGEAGDRVSGSRARQAGFQIVFGKCYLQWTLARAPEAESVN